MNSLPPDAPEVKTEQLYVVVHDATGLPMIAYKDPAMAETCAQFARKQGIACHIDHETPMKVHSVKGIRP